MITTCTRCGRTYEAGSEEQANEPERLCEYCRKRNQTIQRIDNLLVKIRTEERNGVAYAIALVWLDDKRVAELGTVNLNFFDGPGEKSYQDWVDAMSAVFRTWMSKQIGVEVTTKRHKPDYRGEK